VNLEVFSEAKPLLCRVMQTKAGPLPDHRILPVRTDEPAILNSIFSCRDAIRFDIRDARAPQERHSRLIRAIKQKLVQVNPPHCESHTAGKIRTNRRVPVGKSDSTEWNRNF
jgi:hypothetical protein